MKKSKWEAQTRYARYRLCLMNISVAEFNKYTDERIYYTYLLMFWGHRDMAGIAKRLESLWLRPEDVHCCLHHIKTYLGYKPATKTGGH